MDQTNHRSTTNMTKRVLQQLNVLPNTYYERKRLEEICLLVQHQASYCHFIELSIVPKMDLLVK
jgi:hypothetical protein